MSQNIFQCANYKDRARISRLEANLVQPKVTQSIYLQNAQLRHYNNGGNAVKKKTPIKIFEKKIDSAGDNKPILNEIISRPAGIKRILNKKKHRR